MAETKFIRFTPRQESAALDWLERLPDDSMLDGEELWESSAVARLWWESLNTVLRAEVRDRKRYQVSIRFSPKEILDATCTCKGGSQCKHAAAALLTAGDGIDDFVEVEEYEDEFEDEEEEYHGAFPAPLPPPKPAASAAPPATPPPLPSSPPELLTVPPSPLAAYLIDRSGQPISRREAELVAKIEALWRGNNGRLPEPELLALGGHSSYFYGWRPEPMEIWPARRPPRTSIEAFLYVAHGLRERKKLPALKMYQTVDWAAVEALVAGWRREQEIDQWRQRLERLSLTPLQPPPSVEFRLRLDDEGADIEWRQPGSTEFLPIKQSPLRQCANAVMNESGRTDYYLDDAARRFLTAVRIGYDCPTRFDRKSSGFGTVLGRLLRQPGFEKSVVSPAGEPLVRESEPLRWIFREPSENPATSDSSSAEADYEAVLRTAEGNEPGPSLATLNGWPILYVRPDRVYEIRESLVVPSGMPPRLSIPAAAVESPAGVAALQAMKLPLPQRLAARVQLVPMDVTVRCRLVEPTREKAQLFQVSARADGHRKLPSESWMNGVWMALATTAPAAPTAPGKSSSTIPTPDRTQQLAAGPWLLEAGLNSMRSDRGSSIWYERKLTGASLRAFPEFFLDWLSRRPHGLTVELDPELASLRDGTVAGTVRLDVQESGVDWFDLSVGLSVTDIELTQAEIDLLLKSRGRWVRLPDKGWRRLDFQLSAEDEAQLADLGLNAADLASEEKHRLHVFQLAGATATGLLPPERVEQVKRRAEELRTKVTPDLPAAITATLRPYQRDGYHFLAYLSANRFGGILADDMGLGKTVQTLSWLAWLRDTGQLDGPALVVCPKSVQDNWRAEVARFCPSLRAGVWSGETAGRLDETVAASTTKGAGNNKSKATPPADELIVINYTQLRLHEEALKAKKWSAVILDEAQYIKNPSSQTTRAACALQASHRLALSGTPIENRLLDLWSILQFAMPGVLGSRASFTRTFNAKDDPLARRRLSARVRPFVLRRTKKEVARDLPDRIEEEIICELEGPQAALYRAELKRARATLLKAKTSAQLDKLRFNILTSLLRLRQICCHPVLVGAGKPRDESAKLSALLDLLEPLVEEGHKVLVFSQFVEMLELVRSELAAREWPHLVLTGQTENRGALVETFQKSEGASIFLISLKAGGFGLNLTSASYVVLFDPWWNPAVENQAIDRTHRIGQKNTVIAYRLLVRDTIEEKIRQLQKQKSALATDILGEEGFAKALTLDDFRFLLGGGSETEGDPS